MTTRHITQPATRRVARKVTAKRRRSSPTPGPAPVTLAQPTNLTVEQI